MRYNFTNEKSRLNKNIKDVISWHDEGITYDKAIERIHNRWDEKFSHDWCHTISNAEIVTMGLLWSEGNYEKGICRAVEACFDTDCNGATVGSIMGMVIGAKKIPPKWIKPLNDTLETGVKGYNFVKISDMAKKTIELYKKFSI